MEREELKRLCEARKKFDAIDYCCFALADLKKSPPKAGPPAAEKGKRKK